MEGVIYVMSNNCFMIDNHYKIGFTTDIEQRKKLYTTAFPVAYNWDYISEKISNIKTRERLIFQRLKKYSYNRDFFICQLDKIKTTIKDICNMTLEEMNLELNIKKYNLEVPYWLKQDMKRKDIYDTDHYILSCDLVMSRMTQGPPLPLGKRRRCMSLSVCL